MVIVYPIYQKHFSAITATFTEKKSNEKMQALANQFTRRDLPVCQLGSETSSELFSFPMIALR